MIYDGSEAEVCARCGFDSNSWRRRDTTVVFGMLGYWWRHATAGIPDEDLNRRPRPHVWSALEYGLHSAMVIPILRDGIERILAEDGCHAPDPCPEVDTEDATRPLHLDPASILGALEIEGAVLASLVDERRDGWDHVGRLDDGRPWQAEATLLHAVHDTTHHFLDVAEGLTAIGAAGPTQHALVERIDVSGGGVPEVSLGSAPLDRTGVGVDGRGDGQHHARPFEAVCLWSSEEIAQLSTHGHSIPAGPVGESLTVAGVDWGAMRPGTLLQVGTALIELSYPAAPSQRQGGWFSDEAFNRVPDDDHPEWAGWYAWVRRPGLIRVGNAAVVSPSL